MKTTNVGPKKKKMEANMIIPVPGKNGFSILVNNQIVGMREYLDEIGNMELKLIKNTERELEAYLAKYHPEKLKEYYNKKEEAKKSEKEGFEPGE